MIQSKFDYYRIPKQYLRRNLNEMLFWDTVYYLFANKGISIANSRTEIQTYFSIKNDDFCAYAGISKRSFENLRNLAMSAPPPYKIHIEKDTDGWNYIWVITNYEQLVRNNAIRKPNALFTNRWIPYLKKYPDESKPTRLPWAILNRFFAKPAGSKLTFSELIYFSKKDTSKKPPDAAAVNQALTHLIRLGVVQYFDDDIYQLNQLLFDQPPQLTHQPRTLSLDSPIVKQKMQEDPIRAAKALDLSQKGHFEAHFEEIFRDLRYVTTADGMALLERKIQWHKKKPPHPERWERCWKQFNRERQTRSTTHQSPKVHIDLAAAIKTTEKIHLPHIFPTSILWAKIVLWLNTPNYPGYFLPYPIHTTLHLGKQLLWTKEITDGNREIRYDLTHAFRATSTHICDLTLTIQTLLPRVSVDALLEARVWKDKARYK